MSALDTSPEAMEALRQRLDELRRVGDLYPGDRDDLASAIATLAAVAKERDRLAAENVRLRAALGEARRYVETHGAVVGSRQRARVIAHIDAVLAPHRGAA